MDQYIVTGYTPTFWNNWGISWLASLKESGTKAKIVIAHKGDLPDAIHDALTAHGVILVPVGGIDDMRLQTWTTISFLGKNRPGVYAFWDGDVFFQENVSAVFDLATEKMVVCRNLNPGLVAAPSHLWEFFWQFCTAADHINPGITSVDALGAFVSHFPAFVSIQDDTWNFTNIPGLKLGEKLTHRGEAVKVVHPSGHIKNMPETKSYLFAEKYPDVFTRWNGLMNKKGVFTRFLKRTHHEDVQPTRDIS